jgi:hypothetical protein
MKRAMIKEMKMKKSLTVEIGRRATCLGIVVFMALVAGCGNKTKLLNARLDAADERQDAFSEDLLTYGADSKKRSADHEAAMGQLEERLTSKLDEEITASDTASKRRSAGNENAILELENILTSRFDEKIKASDVAGKKRSAGHDAAIRQLKDTMTLQMAAQRQALDQANVSLKKNLDSLKAELENGNERDIKTQLALASTASKADVAGMIKDVRERYAHTQRVLDDVAKSSDKAMDISVDIRTAMQRLIMAHAIFAKGSDDLIAALEAEKTEGESKGSESVYLSILYEQRKAQQRLLKEMQILLLQATTEMQAQPDAKNAQSRK